MNRKIARFVAAAALTVGLLFGTAMTASAHPARHCGTDGIVFQGRCYLPDHNTRVFAPTVVSAKRHTVRHHHTVKAAHHLHKAKKHHGHKRHHHRHRHHHHHHHRRHH